MIDGESLQDIMVFLPESLVMAQQVATGLSRLERIREQIAEIHTKKIAMQEKYDQALLNHSLTSGKRPSLVQLTKLECGLNCMETQLALLKEFV